LVVGIGVVLPILLSVSQRIILPSDFSPVPSALLQLKHCSRCLVVGKNKELAVASLFTPAGMHDAIKGEFAGINDFEVMAWLVLLPEATA
jgi:hypothetical protein